MPEPGPNEERMRGGSRAGPQAMAARMMPLPRRVLRAPSIVAQRRPMRVMLGGKPRSGRAAAGKPTSTMQRAVTLVRVRATIVPLEVVGARSVVHRVHPRMPVELVMQGGPALGVRALACARYRRISSERLQASVEP